MKKVLFFLFALFVYGGAVKAADGVVQSVNDAVSVGDNNVVELKEGSEGVIYVNVTPKGRAFRDSQFEIVLPEGIDVEKVGDQIKAVVSADQPVSEVDGSKLYGVKASIVNNDPRHLRFILSYVGDVPLNDGVLLELYVKPDETLKDGDEVTATMTGENDRVLFSSGDEGVGGYSQPAFDFTIKIVENLITYYDTENYEDFERATETNVKVVRAVKADTWNTICLPFAMTADQIASAFGNDAQVADFTACETEWSEDETVLGIKSTFSSVTAMDAHHPYLLKVSADNAKTATDGFTVKNVEIVSIPEGGAQVYLNATNKGTERNPNWVYDSFIGTYEPISSLGKNGPVAFLSGNKFYYATGSSSLKGFRAYFDFMNLAYYLEDNGLSSNLSFFVDGEEATSIEGVTNNSLPVEGVYDLQGRKMNLGDKGLEGLQKGIYIVNGKKVTVK